MIFSTTFPTVFASGEPELQVYGQLIMRGESIIDEVEFFNKALEDSYLYDRGKTERPLWIDEDTILLMPFENTLDAGNFPTLGNPVLKWRIYRRKAGETSFVFLEEIDNTSANTYYDVRSKSNISYEYGIQSVAEDGTRGGILVSEEISVAEWGWRLSSIDYNEELEIGVSYLFDVELNSNPISTNRDRTKYETYSKNPKIVRGIRNYRTGGITFMPKRCVGETVTIAPHDLVEELYEFLTNGEIKALANGSGDTFIIDIDDNTVSIDYQDRLTNPNGTEQPLIVSFNWDEVDDPQNVL